jgi:hypothetical protein
MVASKTMPRRNEGPKLGEHRNGEVPVLGDHKVRQFRSDVDFVLGDAAGVNPRQREGDVLAEPDLVAQI